MRKLFQLLIVVGAIMSHTAAAQTQTRAGTWASFGLGWGSMNCEDCDKRLGGYSGALEFGFTLSNRVQLGVASHAWIRDIECVPVVVVPRDASQARSEEGCINESGTELTAMFGPIGRFYLSDGGRLFVLGGLGLGLEVSSSGRSETGAAAVLGLGYDIQLSRTVSLTPFLNGVAITLDDHNPE